MKKRIMALLLVLVMVLGLFTACGDSGENTATTPSGDEKKSITVGITVNEASMDPISSSDGFYVMVLGNVLGGLYCVDDNNVLTLDLAESVDVSEDGLTYTFTIRDTNWSDGTPVTANDFVYAWRRVADPTSGTQYAYLVEEANIKNAVAVTEGTLPTSELGVSAPDDKTLVVELERPTPYFASITAFSPFAPLKQEYVESQGENFALTKDNLIYCGAYQLTEWDVSGNTIVMEKNPSYWDAENVDVDEVAFQVIADPQTGVMSYESGDLDKVTVSGSLVSQYIDSPEFSSDLGVFNWYLYFNDQTVPCEKLRQAMAYCIDREALVNNVLKDGSVAQYNLLMTGLYTREDGTNFNDASPDYYKVDKEKAKELWAEAQQETDMRTITLTYEEDSAVVGDVAAFVQSEIETTLEGFSVELQCIPKKSRIANMQNGEYQVALHRWGPDYADPSCIMTLYTKDSPYNYSNWDNAEFNDLVHKCSTDLALDPEARWNAYLDAEAVIANSAVSAPLFQVAEAVLTRPGLEGITNHITGVSCYYKFVTYNPQ